MKVSTGDIPAVVQKLEQQFKISILNMLLNISFPDQDFARQYADESTIGQLALSFTVIAVLISCLGLFDLSSFQPNAE